MITAEMVKPGATVIDVGINRTDAGLAGDVDFARRRARGGRDHPGARRRRADDDRDAAAQHGHRGERPSDAPETGLFQASGDFVANVRTVLYRCAIPSRMRVSQGEDASWQKAQ